MGIALAIVLLLAGGGVFAFMSQAKFGRLPSGERLKRVEASPNYRDGKFMNLSPKPPFSEGVTMWRLSLDFFFRRKERPRPSKPLPVRRTDLRDLPLERDAIVWMGHSGLYMQAGGRRFLIDPNFTSCASPFSWKTLSFDGTDLYTAGDMPAIDYMLITHDHYDHLNYETVASLIGKVGVFVCGLGVGEHLEYWGVPAEAIVEMDWNDDMALGDGVTLRVLPTHHFSGRTFRRDPTLWVSYLLETPDRKIYLGGDSGAGPHFADIGERFGPIDVALLENGQYDVNWKYNHMFPEEALDAALKLRAGRVLPIHAGRFELANHPWDEPYRRFSALAEGADFRLMTPMIGEPVWLDEPEQSFSRWWEGIDG